MKKLISFIFIIFIFFIKTSFAYAYDLSINCNGLGSCTPDLATALFSSSEVWLPNKTLSKTIRVTNTSSKDRKLAVQTTATLASGDLDTVLNLSIIKISSGSLIWSGSLNDFYNASEVQLGILNSGLFEDYEFTVSLGNVGSEFQNKQTSFDLNIGFLSESVSSNSNSSDNSNNTTQTPVCGDSKPNTPGNLSLVNSGFGKVTLSWTAPEGAYTYYLIAYSDNANSPKWGNPNIGNQTSYTVSGLGTGTYWFWVRAGNGCKPGDFIGPMSTSLEGGTGDLIATGFSSGVLSATNSGSLKTTDINNKPVSESNDLFNRFWLFIKRLFQRALNFTHSY